MMAGEHSYFTVDYAEIPVPERDEDFRNLQSIADCSVGDLCRGRYPGLLVFPKELNAYKDDIDKGVICKISDARLTTGDIMGFVGRNETQLTIRSRFAAEGKEDYFLHYLVRKVFAVNLFDLPHSASRESVFDFAVCLFPFHLKAALRQGVFKQYRERELNDPHLRGAVDAARHIRSNTPFGGNVAYRVREYAFDNAITQLIRHTIEYIRSSPFASALRADSDTECAVRAIRCATPSYDIRDRRRIIARNLRPVAHPFFTAYAVLQKLCLQILAHDGLKYGDSDDKICGMLFCGSWLWEEYLHTVLRECGFDHARNKKRTGGIRLFEKLRPDGSPAPCGHWRYPDFFKDDCVLDAKYKHLETRQIDRNDMHQLIAYMYVQRAGRGGFIHPISRDGCRIDVDCLGTLRGFGGRICRMGVPVPPLAGSYREFAEKMRKTEENLKRTLADEVFA